MHPIEPDELMAYLDGELPAARASFAAEHLGNCAECDALASDLRGVSDRMLTWRVDGPALTAPRDVVPTPVIKPVSKPWYTWKAVWCAIPMVPVIIVAGIYQFAQPQRAARYDFAMGPTSALSAPPAPAPAPAPLVAHASGLTVVATNFDRARDAIQQIVKRHNGYIAELTLNAEASSARSLDATLRIPDAQLDSGLADLKSLGRVPRENRTGEEVTQQSIDLDARLANARNTEQRLTELLRRRTDKLSDVLQVEKEIASTRGEIEQMEAARKNLDRRIDYAQVELHVTEVYESSSRSRLRNAAVTGWRSLGESLIDAASLMLAEGPALLFWCLILFFPARYAWKRLRRS